MWFVKDWNGFLLYAKLFNNRNVLRKINLMVNLYRYMAFNFRVRDGCVNTPIKAI